MIKNDLFLKHFFDLFPSFPSLLQRSKHRERDYNQYCKNQENKVEPKEGLQHTKAWIVSTQKKKKKKKKNSKEICLNRAIYIGERARTTVTQTSKSQNPISLQHPTASSSNYNSTLSSQSTISPQPTTIHKHQKNAINSRIKILVWIWQQSSIKRKKLVSEFGNPRFISTNICSSAHHKTPKFTLKTTPPQKHKIKIFIQLPKNQNRIYQRHKTDQESSYFITNPCTHQRNWHF